MKRVADQNVHTSSRSAPARGDKSLLVGPREIPLVVTHKTIVLMRDGIRRIAVNDIATPGALQLHLEVTDINLSGSQHPA
jgi:hypothetical protein